MVVEGNVVTCATELVCCEGSLRVVGQPFRQAEADKIGLVGGEAVRWSGYNAKFHDEVGVFRRNL